LFTAIGFIFWWPAITLLFGFGCVTHLYGLFTIRQSATGLQAHPSYFAGTVFKLKYH